MTCVCLAYLKESPYSTECSSPNISPQEQAYPPFCSPLTHPRTVSASYIALSRVLSPNVIAAPAQKTLRSATSSSSTATNCPYLTSKSKKQQLSLVVTVIQVTIRHQVTASRSSASPSGNDLRCCRHCCASTSTASACHPGRAIAGCAAHIIVTPPRAYALLEPGAAAPGALASFIFPLLRCLFNPTNPKLSGLKAPHTLWQGIDLNSPLHVPAHNMTKGSLHHIRKSVEAKQILEQLPAHDSLCAIFGTYISVRFHRCPQKKQKTTGQRHRLSSFQALLTTRVFTYLVNQAGGKPCNHPDGCESGGLG